MVTHWILYLELNLELPHIVLVLTALEIVYCIAFICHYAGSEKTYSLEDLSSQVLQTTNWHLGNMLHVDHKWPGQFPGKGDSFL